MVGKRVRVCVCVCVCVCERGWKGGREGGREGETDKVRVHPAPAGLRQWCGSPGSLGVRDGRQGICLMSR